MQITVKDINGHQITLDMVEGNTVGDLLTTLRKTYEFTECTVVVEGKMVDESELLSSLSYPIVRLTAALNSIPEFTYNAMEINKALKGHPHTMIYLLHDLATKNPYVLSYLASSPEMVCDYIRTVMGSPDFSITARGSSNYYQVAIEKYDSDLDSLIGELVDSSENSSSGEDEDDFPSPGRTVNPYIVDRDNVNRILANAFLPESDFQRVKDIYLFMDRNYQMTLEYVKNDSTAVPR
jgi:hypothetical protein